jgi:hypothetical protein
MNKHRFQLVGLLLAAVFAVSTSLRLQAQLGGTDEARRIVNEWETRTTSMSYRYDGQLRTIDEDGHTTEKGWTLERLGAHGQSKVVIRFTAPAEVKGVALLIVNHPDRSSDQWMWTPAIERDRRIAMQDRSTRFFGTDFTFEDLEERDVDQDDYALLGEEKVDGAPSWKIAATPKRSKSSQYTKSILFIRKDNYAIARIDFFVKELMVRRLKYTAIRNVQGIWTAHDLTMSDVKRGSRTQLLLDKVQYNLRLDDSRFTLDELRKP